MDEKVLCSYYRNYSEQQILNISVQLPNKLLNPSQKYPFSEAKITRFEKTSFKLMATGIVKIKLHYLTIRIPCKTKLCGVFFAEFQVKSHLKDLKRCAAHFLKLLSEDRNLLFHLARRLPATQTSQKMKNIKSRNRRNVERLF